MSEHLLQGFFTRAFAERFKQGDVAAEKRLESDADIAQNGTRTDGDPASDTECAGDAETVETKRGGDKGGLHEKEAKRASEYFPWR